MVGGDATSDPGHGRVDATQPLIVTIDGPAGSGKSSVAQALADRLGLSVLDTGAMYRTAALACLREGVDPADGATIANLVGTLGIEVDFGRTPPEVRLGGVPVGDAIRSTEVESIVSVVAAQPEVREALVTVQRQVARAHPRLVTEGRDQGSVVFPNAAVRFFLTASAENRAARRQAQLEAEGRHEDPEGVLRRIRDRDRIDENRPDSPLVNPEGAIEVQTDTLGFEEVVDRLEQVVREQVAGLRTDEPGEKSGS